MNRPDFDRRQILSAGAASLAAPLVFAPRAFPWKQERPRSLVLLELEGGMDGLSSLVPFEDDAYYRLRPNLAVAKEQVLPISDELGFPREMAEWMQVFRGRRIAIVQSVGRPGATMSHFKELAAWHEASPDGLPANEGWIGRLRSAVWGEDPRPELVTHVGVDPPRSLRSAEHPPFTIGAPETLVWFDGAGAGSPSEGASGAMEGDRPGSSEMGQAHPAGRLSKVRGARIERIQRSLEASRFLAGRVREITSAYQPRVEYSRGGLARDLLHVAALLDAGFGARVYSLRHKGYDAHSVGCGCTTDRLFELSRALRTFLLDLQGTSAEHDVLVLAYSEFGRRVAENASGGTDHGAAGPMWLLGRGVIPGLHGVRPSLSDLDENGNLRHHVDFRSVYAAVLEGWFGVAHERVLGRRFDVPALLRT